MRLDRQLPLGFLFLALAGCSVTPTASDTTAEKEKVASKRSAFTNIVLSDNIDSKTTVTTFGKDTPKLFVTFDLKGMEVGDKLRGAWVCEESKVAPPNYEIDSAGIVIGIGVNSGNFSISKPTKGWPEGTYRVDLMRNGAVLDSVKFKIGG